ncbi:MAG: hypothetical protein R3291_04750 [Thermoplasmata archaeon]|nr:hypothetical protein [Thermoplasmata archaeon]
MAMRGATPEEAILALSRLVQEGKLTRTELLVELLRVGLTEQKRWKAIHHVETGRVDVQQGAEMAGLDPDAFRELLSAHGRS